METPLSSAELRVLGCLIEKELATPDYYPLTLNSLVAACNQKSNRDPVTKLDDKTVVRALETLRWTHHLVTENTSTANRVPKYAHGASGKWQLAPEELALLCEMFLRGPQTTGELRARAARLHAFSDPQQVEATLQRLSEKSDGPLVAILPREPGRREQRWTHLLCGDVTPGPESAAPAPEPARAEVAAEDARISALEKEATALREDLQALASAFAEFKKQFES